MSTSNPNIFLAKYLDGLNFNKKQINGVTYRTNHFNFKDLNIQINKSISKTSKNKLNEKNEKILNLNQIKSILSDDDRTSEDDYSDNFSFDDNESKSEKNDEKNSNFPSNIDFHDPDFLLSYRDLQLNNNENYNFNKNWTHFIAIPFNKSSQNQELVEKFNYFKNKILEEGFININECLFQNPDRLHITLCMLELKNNNEINKLKKILKENILPEILEFTQKEEIYSILDSFEVFGNPHESRVLYAKPRNNESNKFYNLLDILFSNLVENNVLNKDLLQFSNIIFNEKSNRYEKEKVHLTIMNSTFAMRENIKNNSNTINLETLGSGYNRKKANNYFNGMKIIRRFNNFQFGPHKINEICLYEMKIDSNTNTYKIVESIKLNN